jgi:nitric oxide reductase NorD protein
MKPTLSSITPLPAENIKQALEQWLEVEFTFLTVDTLATAIASLPREEQDFLLGWIRRTATTHIQIAYQFATRAIDLLAHMDRRLIEAWVLHAMDTYDRTGLRQAIQVINEVEHFAQLSHEHAAGAVFDDIAGILLGFVRGLSGRQLKLEQADTAHTDSETLFLPAVTAQMQRAEDNFSLCKAMVAIFWAQTRFGSFRVNLVEALKAYPDPDKALKQLNTL